MPWAAISLQQNAEPCAPWVQLQVSTEQHSSGCSPFPYAHLLHYSPCVIHTPFFLRMTSTYLLSLSLPPFQFLSWPFFCFFLSHLLSPLLPAHPYRHTSLQYTSTLSFFIMNSLFPFPGSWFHNPRLFFLNSQILTTCSFCPDCTDITEEAQSFEKVSKFQVSAS